MAFPLAVRDVVRSTAVTADDQSAIAKVTAAFCTSVALVFLCTRLIVRWPWSRLFGADDAVISIASLTGLVQMGLVFAAASSGLGKKNDILTHAAEIRADKFLYASDLFYVLTLYLSRAAIVLFFFRLENSSQQSIFVKVLAGACAALGVISLIIVGLQQYRVGSWILPSASTAGGILARWVAVEVVGDIFDIFLVIYPIYLVRSLQMRLSMKIKVVLGVASRFPLVIISAMRLVYLSRSLYSDQYFFTAVDTEILTQVEMSFALMAATVPTLQIFLRAAKSSLLGETVHTQTGSAGMSYGQNSRQQRSRNPSNITRSANRHSIELSNINGGKTTTMITKGSSAHSLESDSSERAIVMHHTIHVQTEENQSNLGEDGLSHTGRGDQVV